MKKLKLTALLLTALLVLTGIFTACAPVIPPPSEQDVQVSASDISNTTNSITLTVPSEQLEYGLFDGETQVKNFIASVDGKVVFTELEDGKTYEIRARAPASGKSKASASVTVIEVSTKELVSPPTAFDFSSCTYVVTPTSIAVKVVKFAYEYALTLDEEIVGSYVKATALNSTITFSGLTPGEEYVLVARKFTATQESVNYDVKTIRTLSIPSAPLATQLQLEEDDLNSGLESLSLKVPSDDYEYCIKQEGEFVKGWKRASDGTVIFDGLERGNEYDVYARVPAVSGVNVYSAATLVISFTTSSSIDAEEAFEEWLDKQFLIEMYASSTISVHYTLKDVTPYNFALSLIAAELEDEWGEAVGAIYGLDDVRMYSVDLAGLEDTSNEELEELLAEVLAFDDAYLNTSQRLLKAILVQYIQTNMTDESINLNYYGTYLDTSSGVQSNMPINFAEYTFYTELDVQIYLKLLEKLDEFFQECIDYELAREDRGLGLSDSSLDAAIEQCEAFLECTNDTLIKNYLITTFNSRIDALELEESKAEEYKNQNAAVFNNHVIPAYQLLIDELPKFKTDGEYDYEEEENELGLSYFEHGKEYYEYLIEYTTGSDKTVDEMYQALIRSANDAYSVYNRYRTSSTAAFSAYQNFEAEADYNHDGTVSREEILQYANEMVNQLQVIIATKFPSIPENDYNIKMVEAALEDTLTSSAFFMIPPIDDYLNNVIYINAANSDVNTMFSLLAHEGFPGHLYQNVYHLNTNPHEMRSVFSFNGYAEGWASYVENLAYGWFSYGQYSSEIAEINQSWDTFVLSLLCAIDIGVNYYGWTFAQYESFMASNNLNAPRDTFDFFIASPGTYVKYGIGYLEMADMREYAENELGSAFDEKAFHKAILDVGPCQFNLVWAAVEDYVSLEKAKIDALLGDY